LGALEPAERQSFEAHLATCVTCQRELADMRRVTAGLGMAADPVRPPDALKAKTIARATSQPQARATQAVAPMTNQQATRFASKRRMSPEWLLAAASLAAAIGVGFYAWSLRVQVGQMQGTVTELSSRANELRGELDRARREAARLTSIIDIVQSPTTLQVSLTGTPAARDAVGRAAFNATRGMVVSTEKMPALRPGRTYQLWVIVPGQPAPLSAGVFDVTPAGVGNFIATLPSNLTVPPGAAVTLAVTEEPAGGSRGPTLPVLLAGQMKMQ
jgi:hypothetical protein